ncbi:hypothetical protein ABG768_001854 [Culter alburnus]|uniref:Sushi domain-containing protein n=1 Tax=Culter alburnus TaxID=194366 RepID=A0AAW2A1V7_CULAL
MRVPVKLLSFVFWLFFFNCAQSQEITCTAPVISNGFVVEPEEEYQRDAILKYRCSPGFKAREGIPRCAKFGWTLNPECDEVTCEHKSTRFGVQKINPEGKTIFRAEESVEITCTEKYWIIFTKEAIRSFTCQENGEWDHQPVCEVIRCEVPRDQQLHNPYSYFRGDMTLETKKSYSCISGYEKKATVATCTREGWTPKPLCAKKMCAAPNIPNAEILGDQRQEYKINSRIQYKCRRGFEPEQPVEITCNSRTEWTGIRPCIDIKNHPVNLNSGDHHKACCSAFWEPPIKIHPWLPSSKQKLCPAPSVENGFIHTLSSNEEEIFYSCDTGYKPFSSDGNNSVINKRQNETQLLKATQINRDLDVDVLLKMFGHQI